MELSGLVVNPEMKAVYDEAIKQNKKIIIVSDMYLPADFIKKVLHKNLHNIFSYKFKWKSRVHGQYSLSCHSL